MVCVGCAGVVAVGMIISAVMTLLSLLDVFLKGDWGFLNSYKPISCQRATPYIQYDEKGTDTSVLTSKKRGRSSGDLDIDCLRIPKRPRSGQPRKIKQDSVDTDKRDTTKTQRKKRVGKNSNTKQTA